MKFCCLLTGLFILCKTGTTQNIQGVWVGSFTTVSNSYSETTKLKLVFEKLSDSTFKAFSITYFENTKKADSVLCILQGGFVKKDLLYLREIQELKNSSNFRGENICMQLMKLFFTEKKKESMLKGTWYTEKNKCGSGTIQLTKQND
jgi:hypothetical protein